jgi:hypothetical protein
VLKELVVVAIPTNVPVELSPTFTVDIPIKLLDIFATYTVELFSRVVVTIPVCETTSGLPPFTEYVRISPVSKL